MISQNLLQSPPDNMRPAVAVDLEGTLTAGSAWRGMSEYLIAHGREREAKRYFLRHIPEYYLRKWTGRGLREFKNRWILGFLQLFQGTSKAAFREMTEWAVENELWPKRRQIVVDEIGQHQGHDRRVMVVTGLFEPYVASMIERLPEVEAIGTPILFEEDLVTGQLAMPFNVGPLKAEALAPFTQDGRIYSAYGDTGSDRYMLEISRHPVAVYPDDSLRNLAENEGWRILDET
jgi:phosphoserine phosphatase